MDREEAIVHLSNIVDSIFEIEGYTEGMDYKDFVEDEETRGVIMRNLQVIGDAAYNISQYFEEDYTDMDLRVLEGLRVSTYDDAMEISYEDIWNIIKKDLPYVREEVQKAIERLENLEEVP